MKISTHLQHSLYSKVNFTRKNFTVVLQNSHFAHKVKGHFVEPGVIETGGLFHFPLEN